MTINWEEFGKLFKKWELPVMVLFSLIAQITLVALGERRKYSNNNFSKMAVWVGYVLADWLALSSLTMLSQSQPVCEEEDPNYMIKALWAPFLLLHFGGPDTITAYSLEDNKFWARHLLRVLGQVYWAIYVFCTSLKSSPLNFVAIPVLFAGLVKNWERIYILWSASSEQFRESLLGEPDPGPNYEKFMEEYVLKENEGFRLSTKVAQAPAAVAHNYEKIYKPLGIPNADVLSAAYDFFIVYKCLFADLILSFQDIEKSRSYFLATSWKKAFQVIEIELGFMYDLLYTKAKVIHTRGGSFMRLATLFSSILALIAFFAIVDWHEYSLANVIITIVLLVGAICLEMYMILLIVSSDWMMLWVCRNPKGFAEFIYRISSCFSCMTSKRKWSNSMGQYDLISSCLKKHNKPTKCCKSLKEMLENYRRGSSTINVSEYLKEFIFEHLLDKAASTKLKYWKRWCAARGNKVLQKNKCEEQMWSVKVEFDHSILLWHIATYLCYFSDYPKGKSYVKDKNCEVAKMLSDYLVYILVKLPFMLPNGIGQIRFRDTCAEAMEFFKDRKTLSKDSVACMKLLRVETKIRPSKVKGDRSKSLLFDACLLAKSLQSLERKKKWRKDEKWKMINHVWVEMLSYAASQCGCTHHAEEMRNGGELITHVWLLMAHLGLTEQFQISRGHARIKLIVR